MTIVGGDPKAFFSLAITPRCRRSRYSFLSLSLSLCMCVCVCVCVWFGFMTYYR